MVRIINWDDFEDDELIGDEYDWRHALERKKNKTKRQFDDGSRVRGSKKSSAKRERGKIREINDQDL